MGFARRKGILPTFQGSAWLQHVNSWTHGCDMALGFVLLQPPTAAGGSCCVPPSLGWGLEAFLFLPSLIMDFSGGIRASFNFATAQ